MKIRLLAALSAVALLAAGTSLAAQTPTTQAPDTLVVNRPTVILAAGAQPAAHVHQNLLTIQPLSAVAELYAAEFEHAMATTWTLGVGANYWSPDNGSDGLDYLSGDLKARYYPGARALKGFSFGGSVGVTRVGAHTGDTRESTTGLTIGTALEYGWLLGPTESFYVGLGLGAKSLFIGEKDFTHDATLHYPTARISVGWAF